MVEQTPRDRSADEIEVTPEMIEVGVKAYLDFTLDICEIEGRVEEIYTVMERVRKANRGR